MHGVLLLQEKIAREGLIQGRRPGVTARRRESLAAYGGLLHESPPLHCVPAGPAGVARGALSPMSEERNTEHMEEQGAAQGCCALSRTAAAGGRSRAALPGLEPAVRSDGWVELNVPREQWLESFRRCGTTRASGLTT